MNSAAGVPEVRFSTGPRQPQKVSAAVASALAAPPVIGVGVKRLTEQSLSDHNNKNRRVEGGAGPGVAPHQSGFLTCTGSSPAPSMSPTGGKGPSSEMGGSELSLESGALKGMRSYERCLAKASLDKCLLEINMEPELTNVRRSITTSLRDSPMESHPQAGATPQAHDGRRRVDPREDDAT